MKITFKKIIGSVASFRELQEIKFPPRTSLDIYKLGKELDRELEAYRELSKGIYINHNVPETPEGFDLKAVKESDFELIAKDLEELLESEVEIKDTEIPLEVFEKYNLPISASMLIALDWLIKTESKEE